MARADIEADAFLCCPGPSLKDVGDLRGPGRIVYALNTAYPHIKPDVWIGLDRVACFDRNVWSEAFPKVARMILGDTETMKQQPNVFFADLEKADPASIFTRRDNESKFVWDKNSLIFALHFLIWRGHKRIYFVGCDMGGATDYHDGRVLSPELRAGNRQLYDAQVRTLERLTPIAQRNGIAFNSCTPDSPLNGAVMPYIPLENLQLDFRRTNILHAVEAEEFKEYSFPSVLHTIERNVVMVLKSGGDFAPAHVERLARQLRGHPSGATLLILTDMSFDREIDILTDCLIPLKHDLPGWWSKIELFRPDFMPNKPFLYLDLDATAKGYLPDAFFTQAKSVAMGPYTKEQSQAKGPGWIQTNIMWLLPEDRAKIWAKWITAPNRWMRDFTSDQGFVNSCEIDWTTWQDVMPNAVTSYPLNVKFGRDFDGNPIRESDIKVLCYFRSPRPWEVEAA